MAEGFGVSGLTRSTDKRGTDQTPLLRDHVGVVDSRERRATNRLAGSPLVFGDSLAIDDNGQFGVAFPIVDTTNLVKDPADATKTMRIDVGAVTTSTNRILTMPDQNVDLTPNTGTFSADVHASRHQSGGADAIKLDNLSAPDDNTDLNASTSVHGLLLKLDNVATNFLSGQGAWAVPTGAGDVTGPGSSTDNAIPRFDGTGGKTLQDSLIAIQDTNGYLLFDSTADGVVTRDETGTDSQKTIVALFGQWGGTNRGLIGISTGYDTVNKDDSILVFQNSEAGTQKDRLLIEPDGGCVFTTDAYQQLVERTTTPADPAVSAACNIYFKDDKLIFQYDDAGTTRWKYLDLTGTGVTWVATTSAP